MVQRSILDSFWERLPSAHDETPRSDSTHITGTSLNADPPATALEVPVSKWLTIADRLLRAQDISESLSRKALPEWESTRAFYNEADIVSAAGTQIMNPVDVAITKCHTTLIQGLNEVIVNGRTEDYTLNSRVDRLYRAMTNPSTPLRNFVALDYKRIGTIETADFRPFFDAGRHALQTGEYTNRARPQTKAYILLKIATNYAASFNTRYIAFCDWDTLLLVVMEDSQGLSGGDWCRLTVVTGSSEIRRALLGFLEVAYTATIRGNNEYLLPHERPAIAAPSRRSGRIAGQAKPAYVSPDNTLDDGIDTSGYQYNYSAQQRGSSRQPASKLRSYEYSAGKSGGGEYGGDDLGMGRLTLESTPRYASSSRDHRTDRYGGTRRTEEPRPVNPFTPLPEQYQYDSRYSRR
jgi:hypothetical protein